MAKAGGSAIATRLCEIFLREIDGTPSTLMNETQVRPKATNAV
jgi:hypothetical protein